MKHIYTFLFSLITLSGICQNIGDFTSVKPTTQFQQLILPSTHTFQMLIQGGDVMEDGNQFSPTTDFTGYVPINGSSSNGYLSVNNESVPGGFSVLNIHLNQGSSLWSIDSSYYINGNNVAGVYRPCSGGLTKWGTVIGSEEYIDNNDLNGDGYFDAGWHVEINPATGQIVDHDQNGQLDKIWAMGRMKHENVAIASDSVTAYYGADDGTYGFIYKYVASQKGNLLNGVLYVLSKPSLLSATGSWAVVANTTIADRNNTNTLAQAAGATNFVNVEDVEIGPDGKIYFATKVSGRIYRFNDVGTGVINFEVFVENMTYNINSGDTITPEPFGIGIDNLAFDGQGNLFALQDGDKNLIWVIRPGHTTASPKVEVFATTPAGSEPTGITFSPDYKYLFMSFQHPHASNTYGQVDAAGDSVLFNRSSTVVISRKEYLSVEQVDQKSLIHLYPNPASDIVNVHVNFKADKVMLVNMLGELVEVPIFIDQDGDGIISVKNLSKGLYLIRVSNKLENLSARLIVK